MSSMLCINLVLQTGWLIHGTAYRIALCLLLIRLNHVLIYFGKIKMLYKILKHNCTELEVAVKVCVKNISKLLVYLKCLYDAGIQALACARLFCLRLRLIGWGTD